MAHTVVWSRAALDDVEDIASFIARDSAAYAQAVVGRIVDVTRRISDHPLAGRIVPERADERYRETFVYSYRLIYRVDTDRVLIVAVIHGKRLLSAVDERLS
ncbi:MAG: type II toxin-antitoxin system RelE/ParE family toxin [Gammaproteobacteria bacterium]|nr:type II toxin-antitoxin system RelE/ParE family toxin [Gammaproteobacteria bacterium]